MLMVLTLMVAMEKTIVPAPPLALPDITLYKVAAEGAAVAQIGSYGSKEACNIALDAELKKSGFSSQPYERRPMYVCMEWG
jgi:hypothetical protein